MSRILPIRRHSFATVEKKKEASSEDAVGKKKGGATGGRFKRWRKVSFNVGDTIHHFRRDLDLTRSLSSGDAAPPTRPLSDIREAPQSAPARRAVGRVASAPEIVETMETAEKQKAEEDESKTEVKIFKTVLKGDVWSKPAFKFQFTPWFCKRETLNCCLWKTNFQHRVKFSAPKVLISLIGLLVVPWNFILKWQCPKKVWKGIAENYRLDIILHRPLNLYKQGEGLEGECEYFHGELVSAQNS